MKEHLYNSVENSGNSLDGTLACGSMREYEKYSAWPILANESEHPIEGKCISCWKHAQVSRECIESLFVTDVTVMAFQSMKVAAASTQPSQ